MSSSKQMMLRLFMISFITICKSHLKGYKCIHDEIAQKVKPTILEHVSLEAKETEERLL